jgi:hypothetical protein
MNLYDKFQFEYFNELITILDTLEIVLIRTGLYKCKAPTPKAAIPVNKILL